MSINDSQFKILGKKGQRRNSFPFVKKIHEADVQDLIFVNEMHKIKKAILEEKYRDNCYAEPKPIIDESLLKKGMH